MANDLQLSVRLTGDGRQLVGTLRDAEGHVRQFGDVSESQSARVSSALSGIRTAAGFAAAALGGLTLGRVINETAQFQDTMLGLRAVSGATAEQMRSLQEQARTLGATTRYSAQEAGEAQRYLAQAGLQVNQVLSATPGILNLATAGQLDLAQAADIASNVLGGMQLPVSELNRVMDVMAAAASSSNTNIQQLGEALKEAAPIAKTAGLSIEETTTAISILSNAGIQSGRAGTAVLGFIRQLSNITPQAKDVLASYGLTLQDVNLETRGLANVLDTLLDANISTADAFKIFASEAGPAAQVLTSGADSAREFIQRLKDAAGATDEMAAILGSGLSNSLRTLNSALSESILQIGEGGLGGAVGYLADTSAGVLSVYNDMLPAFAKANNLTSKQVDTIESLADGFGALALVAGVKLTSALGSSATAFVKNQYALQANYKAGVEYTQQVLRRTAAEVRASEQIYARAVADAKATAGTNAHAFALNNLAAADARATEAKSAHTVATNAYTAAAERASIASRATAGAMALVGGPLGAAVLAGAAVYYFRDELGLTSPAAREAKGEIDALVKSLDNYTQAQYESSRVPIVKDLAEARIEAKKLQDQIDDLKDQGKDQGMWYQGFSGSATHEIAELNTKLREQERIIAANEEGLSEYDEKWQAVIKSQTSGVAIFKTLDQWMDGLGGKFRDTSVGVQSVSLALGASGEDWDSYISKLQDARNTLGMTAAEAEKYAATQAGYTGLYAEQAGAVAGQTAALEDYRSAIEKGNKAEAQTHLSRAQRYAEAESMVIAQLQNLDTLTGLLRGVQTELSATALSAALVIGDSAGNTSALIAESLRLLNERAGAIRQNTVVTKRKTEADRAAAQAARSQANALQALQDKLDPVAKLQRDFLADQITLQTAWAAGKLTLDQYLTSVGKLPTLYQNAGDAAQVYELDGSKAAKTVSREMTYLETAIKRSVERLDDTFVDFWKDTLSGAKNTFQSFKDLAISTLAEIIHAYTTRRITASLGLSLAGTGSAAASGTGGGGMGGFGGGGMDLTSLGKTIYQGITDGFGAINWTGAPTGATAYTSGFGSQVATGGGMFGGSLQNFSGFNGLASLGAGYVGSQLGTRVGSSLFGKQANSSWGATAGGAIGTYFGGPVGAFAGSALGGMVDSLFGSSRKYKAGFVNYANAPKSDDGTPFYSSGNYRNGDLGRGRETPFGSFGFTYKTKYEPSDMIDLLDAMAALDNVLAAGASKDQIATVKDALDGWTGRVSQESLGRMITHRYSVITDALEKSASEVTAKLIDRVGVINSKTAEKAVPQLAQALQLGNLIDGLSGNVQDYAERVVSDTTRSMDEALSQITAGVAAHAAVSGIADELNLTFDDMGDRAVEAALNLQQLAGGIDALQSQAQTYYQAFYSDAERAQRAIEQLSPTLYQAGLSAYSTREQFRAVVESLDLNTAAGRETYTQLMSVAGAFAEISDPIKETTQSLKELQAAAESQIESAKDAVRKAYETFAGQAFDQQVALLQLAGRDQEALNLQRAKELETIDESLRPIQQRIWALQDEQSALEGARQASADYRSALEQASSQLSGTLGNISTWIDQQTATGGSPGVNLQEAQAQFARELIKAQNGDRDALNAITQYADRYQQAGTAYYGSGTGYQRIRDEILDALGELPDQVSAEEYVAKEFKAALIEQTDGITTKLADVLRGDNPASIGAELAGYFATLAGGIDGVLTRDQLRLVMNGKATDRQLDAMIRALDLNGDEIVSGLESVVIAGMPTDATLANVLGAQLRDYGNRALTERQVRAALSPIATDAQIRDLIRTTDANGDGLLDAQEVANARLSGLAKGIAGSLDSMFSDLDKTMDGRLTFDELRDGLDGIATDSEIRKLIRQVDLNGDGTISALEAVVIKGMPTDSQLANTLRNQLRANGDKALTASQVRSALSPIATDAQIRDLIRTTDANGDGLLDAQEVANARLGGLARGIAGALDSNFDKIDSSLDGLIDYSEFGRYFKGLASDAQLKQIFRQLDQDGDGQISALEAVKASTDKVGNNTGSMEARSLEQLERLTNLTAEMTRTSDQFITLNSNMVSLREAIGALGVAQSELARIEKERKAAAEAEQRKAEQARAREQQRASIQSEISSAQTRVGDFNNQIAAWQRRTERETGLDVDGSRFSRLLSIAASRNYLLADYETFTQRAHAEGDPAFWYAAEIARDQAYKQRYQDHIKELEAELSRLDGSHANGLSYVPWDGYRAELHQGEHVSTAKEAPAVRAFLSGRLSPPPMAPATDNRRMENLLERLARLTAENTELLRRIEAHEGAGVRVAQAGHQRSIDQLTRIADSNQALDDRARLEALA